ncbi:MAG: hypothetical protein ACU0CO_03700 [Shimia sp.]
MARGPIALGRLHDELRATPELEALLRDVPTWTPTPPRTVRELADRTVRMCRLLRAETADQLAAGATAIQAVRDDWTDVLAQARTTRTSRTAMRRRSHSAC